MALNRYIIRKKWWIGKKKGFLNETGGFTRGKRLELVVRGTPTGMFEEKLRLLQTLARSTDGARAIIDETIRRLMAIRSGESLDWNAEKKKAQTAGRKKE